MSFSNMLEILQEKNKDRIVHRWVVDNFLVSYFVPTFINTTYACLKGRGMHKACLDVQKAMLHCKRIWNEYYILKMDIKKYNVITYDEKADYVYANLKHEDVVMINGYLEYDKVILEDIQILL